MVAYLTRATSGVAGDVTRQPLKDIVPRILNTTNPPLAFGAPVKMVNNEAEAIQTGDTADDFYGVVVRQVFGISGGPINLNPGFNSGVPNVDYPADIMDSGYINIVCTIGTPEINGPVFMRVVASGPSNVGDFEATSVPGENVALPGVTFAVAGKDANNVTEINISKV